MRPLLSDQPWQGFPGIQRDPQTQPTYTEQNKWLQMVQDNSIASWI